MLLEFCALKAQTPTWIIKEKPEKPNKPDTGDTNNLGGWLALLAIAGAGGAGLYIKRRREDQ